jgi:hypothetical protein
VSIIDELRTEFSDSAKWPRQKAAEYRLDAERNLAAAVILDRLAKTVKDIDDPLMKEFDALGDHPDWPGMVRQVGFSLFPKDAAELLADFIATHVPGRRNFGVRDDATRHA